MAAARAMPGGVGGRGADDDGVEGDGSDGDGSDGDDDNDDDSDGAAAATVLGAGLGMRPW